MTKILIITGLTGSGKSNLAIEIAKLYNGEIISADSVQIYKGLDIGSAKESKVTMSQISHHLIDIKEFNETYNVGEFVNDCNIAITNILSKNKLPIIVGGTGLYIKALMEGYNLGSTTANEEFRQHYQDLAKENGNLYVWKLLEKQNPEKAKSVHYNNLKRVIRYLEIEKFGQTEQNQPSILSHYEICAVGIVEEREKIYNRINARVDKMIEAGLENEVKTLVNLGANDKCQSMNSIGYKEWFAYLNNLQSLEETINLIKQHTRNYCKRQLTFLKTINNIKLATIDEAKYIIKEFLND